MQQRISALLLVVFMTLSVIFTALPSLVVQAADSGNLLSVKCEDTSTVNAAFGTIVNVPQGKYVLSAYVKANEGSIRLMARYANTFSNTEAFANDNGGSKVRANFTPVDSTYFEQSGYPRKQNWIKDLDCDEEYYKSSMTFDLTGLAGDMVSENTLNLLIGCDFVGATEGYVYGFELYALDENGNPTGDNLIANGDFSNGTEGWIFRDGANANPTLSKEVVTAKKAHFNTVLEVFEKDFSEKDVLLNVECSETDNVNINAAFGTIVNVPQGKYVLSAYTKATKGSIRLMARYANTYSNTNMFSNNNGGGTVRKNFTPVDSSYFHSSGYPATQSWVKDLDYAANYSKASMTFDLTTLSGSMISDGKVNLLIGCDFIDITKGYVYGFELYALDENGNPTGDNLIENGDFSNGAEEWIFRDGEGANPSLTGTFVTAESLGASTAREFFKEEALLNFACSESGTINAAFGTFVNAPQAKYVLSAYTKATKGSLHLMARYANTYSNTDKFSSNNGGSAIRANFTPVDSSYFNSSNYPTTQIWDKDLAWDEDYHKVSMEFDLTTLSGAMVSDGKVNLLIGCDFVGATEGYVYGFELYALDENGNPTGDNLIANGDFSDGTEGWIFRDGKGANPSLTDTVVSASSLGCDTSVQYFKISKYAEAVTEESGGMLIIKNMSDDVAIAKYSEETYSATEGYDVSFVLDESSSDINVLLGFSGTSPNNVKGVCLQLTSSAIKLNILETGKSIQSLEYDAPETGDEVTIRVTGGSTIEIYVDNVLEGSYYLAEQISEGVIPDGTVALMLNNNGDYVKMHDLSVGEIMESPESEYVLGDTIELDYQCYNIIGSHDLDKDGYLDIVVTSNGNIYSSSRSDYNNKVYICYGLEGGTFEDPVALVAGVIPYELAMDDLNNDGWIDIVVGIIGDIDGNDAIIYLNNGARDYTRKVITVDQSMGPLNGHYSSNAVGTIGKQGGILCPAIADFDNDGYKDLVLTGYDRSLLYVYKGDGTGEFDLVDTYQSIDYGYGLHTAKAADFDGDGNMDLVVTNQDTTTSVEVFRGNGDCTFTLMHKYDFAKGSISYHVSIDDYNKDGKLDFITSQYYGGIELFINQGSFEFTRDTYTSANYNQVREIQVADLNDDGELDVATLSRGTNCLSIMYGTGDYTAGNYFGSPTHYFVGQVPKGLSINDYNQDGVDDLALLRYSGKDILLLYGASSVSSDTSNPDNTEPDNTNPDNTEPDNINPSNPGIDSPKDDDNNNPQINDNNDAGTNTNAPKTGDSNNVVVRWLLICGVSAVSLALGCVQKKKRA